MKARRSLAAPAFALFILAACGGENANDEMPAGDAAATPGELLPHQALAREILKELIEINTTDSVGDNTAAALYQDSKKMSH